MEHSITVSLDHRPGLLYKMDELAVGQMRGTSPCSRKPFHAHDGYMLEFVEKGSMWLLEPNARRSLVGQGQYYVLRPDQEHSQEVDPHIHTLFVGLPASRHAGSSLCVDSSDRPGQSIPICGDAWTSHRDDRGGRGRAQRQACYSLPWP